MKKSTKLRLARLWLWMVERPGRAAALAVIFAAAVYVAKNLVWGDPQKTYPILIGVAAFLAIVVVICILYAVNIAAMRITQWAERETLDQDDSHDRL